MCDFRNIKKIVYEDGSIIDTTDCQTISYGQIENITEPGLYHIAGSGAYHLYFDGDKWTSEFTYYSYDFWKKYDTAHRPAWKPVVWEYDETWVYENGGCTGFTYEGEIVDFPSESVE